MAQVLLAMSGGVDSSVAAHLLLQQGHRVTGVFMQHLPERPPAETGGGDPLGCGSTADARDALCVAEKLGIPLEIYHAEEPFQGLIDFFVDEYLRGRTPNPCIVCNRRFKFGGLFDLADRLGAEYLATGHYVRRVSSRRWLQNESKDCRTPLFEAFEGEDVALCRGADPTKDQSYMLMQIERNRLPRLLFPLGEMTKKAIRKIAESKDLHIAKKKESQEICFVPDQDHADFIRHRRPKTDTSGEIITTTGEVVGHHEGLEQYTIGQRKGLRIAFGERKFVVRLDAKTRRVVVGDREELAVRQVFVRGMNWLIPCPRDRFRCEVQFRYRTRSVQATVVPRNESNLEVHFDEPNYGIAPGQGLACYVGDRLLGGGWMDRIPAGAPPR